MNRKIISQQKPVSFRGSFQSVPHGQHFHHNTFFEIIQGRLPHPDYIIEILSKNETIKTGEAFIYRKNWATYYRHSDERKILEAEHYKLMLCNYFYKEGLNKSNIEKAIPYVLACMFIANTSSIEDIKEQLNFFYLPNQCTFTTDDIYTICDNYFKRLEYVQNNPDKYETETLCEKFVSSLNNELELLLHLTLVLVDANKHRQRKAIEDKINTSFYSKFKTGFSSNEGYEYYEMMLLLTKKHSYKLLHNAIYSHLFISKKSEEFAKIEQFVTKKFDAKRPELEEQNTQINETIKMAANAVFIPDDDCYIMGRIKDSYSIAKKQLKSNRGENIYQIYDIEARRVVLRYEHQLYTLFHHYLHTLSLRPDSKLDELRMELVNNLFKSKAPAVWKILRRSGLLIKNERRPVFQVSNREITKEDWNKLFSSIKEDFEKELDILYYNFMQAKYNKNKSAIIIYGHKDSDLFRYAEANNFDRHHRENFYSSIHIHFPAGTVFRRHKRETILLKASLECHMMTMAMDDINELGTASHANYKQKTSSEEVI